MSVSSIIYVLDLPKMVAFYERGLGLVTVERGETHQVLESEALSLVLVKAPPRIADTITVTDPPRRRSENPTKLVFACHDIDAVRSRAAGLGGQIDPADTQWAFRSTLRCDGIDPEGNVIQLRQLGVISS